MNPPLERFATAYTIPTLVAKQDRPVNIGPCVYGRWEGIYVYKVYSSMHAVGLKRDGSWHKYGDPFPSHQSAYETLMATTN